MEIGLIAYATAASLLGGLTPLLAECFSHRDRAEDIPKVVTSHLLAEVAAFGPLPEADEGTLQRILSIGHPLPSAGEGLLGEGCQSETEAIPEPRHGGSVAGPNLSEQDRHRAGKIVGHDGENSRRNFWSLARTIRGDSSQEPLTRLGSLPPSWSVNRIDSFFHCRLTMPVGPERCLATTISASPGRSSGL